MTESTPTVVRQVEGELAPPSSNQGLLEVFRRRYLLRLLVKREISARYEGSFLGLLWSYINPASQFFIYWFVMGRIMKLHESIPNFAIHIFSAIIVVHFFTETFGAGTRSIVRNKSLVVKMAMPREMFPVAAMLVSLYHVLPQLVILLVVLLATGWVPTVSGLAAMLLALAIAMILGTALALLFSTANVFFRDFGSFVGILTNYVRFGVPMIYSFGFVAAMSDWVQELYLANPIASAVLLMQETFWVPSVGAGDQDMVVMPDHLLTRGLVALGVSVVFLIIGQLVFSKLENKIPERI